MLSLSSVPTLPGVSTKDSPSIKENIKPGPDSKREEGDSTPLQNGRHATAGILISYIRHVAKGSGSELGKCGGEDGVWGGGVDERDTGVNQINADC